MTRYEIVFVVHPDRTDEDARNIAERMGEFVIREGGQVLKVEEWGKRKLAYEIKKQSKGIYVLMQIAGTGLMLNEIERMFRISDDVLKYLCVAVEEEDAAAAAGQQPPAPARRSTEGGEEGGGEEAAPVAAAAGRERGTE